MFPLQSHLLATAKQVRTVPDNIMAEIEEEKSNCKRTRRRVGDATSTGGDKLFICRSKRGQDKSDDNALNQKKSFPTQCPIPGCMDRRNKPDHPCYQIGCCRLIHNLCAQSAGLCSSKNELNMFCSKECKRKGDNR